MNVIVDYVLKTYDKKLTRARVETIAGEWSRKQIETVEEAMEIAKKTHKASLKKSHPRNNQVIEKEVPIWFNQNIEVNSATDEERQAIEDMLKEYR